MGVDIVQAEVQAEEQVKRIERVKETLQKINSKRNKLKLKEEKQLAERIALQKERVQLFQNIFYGPKTDLDAITLGLAGSKMVDDEGTGLRTIQVKFSAPG